MTETNNLERIMTETEKLESIINSDRDTLRIETLHLFENLLRKRKNSELDRKYLSAHANVMFDTLLGLVPMALAQLAELDQTTEDFVVQELRRKFEIVRDAITEEREEMGRKKVSVIEKP